MAGTGGSGRGLYATTWVHVFEEDTAEGAVYRPEDADIPLSRRPRERLEFGRDGSARLFVGGDDDRLVEHAAAWRDGESPPAAGKHEGADVRIVHRSPDRLVVRIRGVGPTS
jgi:hypothetical protein